jgi:hypothetical protein
MVVQDGHGASAKDKQYVGPIDRRREQAARRNPVQTGPDYPGYPHWSPAGTRIQHGAAPGPLEKAFNKKVVDRYRSKKTKRRLTGGPKGHPGLR